MRNVDADYVGLGGFLTALGMVAWWHPGAASAFYQARGTHKGYSRRRCKQMNEGGGNSAECWARGLGGGSDFDK